MDEYESYEQLIYRAEVEFSMREHAPDCSFDDIEAAIFWVVAAKSLDCIFAPWCAISDKNPVFFSPGFWNVGPATVGRKFARSAPERDSPPPVSLVQKKAVL